MLESLRKHHSDANDPLCTRLPQRRSCYLIFPPRCKLGFYLLLSCCQSPSQDRMGRIETKAKHRRPVSETAAPSRGQRKRALKKASLVKKKGLTERAPRGREEHKNGGDLAAASWLPDMANGGSTLPRGSPTRAKSRGQGQTAFQRVVSSKGKKTLVAAEMGQLSAVLAAPSFQQDPFAAIQAHLRQTACPEPPTVDHHSGSSGKTKSKITSKTKTVVGKKAGQETREVRGDRQQKAKPYKGRNAKMRVKR